MKLFKRLAVASASLVTSLTVMVAPVAAAPSVLYNNIAKPVPNNVPSVGFEATQASELGGQIELDGTARTNLKVTVLMSSWGCENGNWHSADCTTTSGATFSHPVTLRVYNVGANNTPGSEIATVTKTFAIPYRPSTTPDCADGKWSKDGAVTCYNGLATPISFELEGTTLPSTVILSIAYNTTHHGYAPLGELACYTESGGCGYDSLNVGVETSLTVGAQPLPESAYFNSSNAAQYCDPSLTPGTFRLDEGCWEGYQPSFKVEAKSTTEQCKNNGWKTLTNPKFKNQGDCVSYVSTGGTNLASF